MTWFVEKVLPGLVDSIPFILFVGFGVRFHLRGVHRRVVQANQEQTRKIAASTEEQTEQLEAKTDEQTRQIIRTLKRP